MSDPNDLVGSPSPAAGAPAAPAADPSPAPAPAAHVGAPSPGPAPSDPNAPPSWLPARLREERDRAVRQSTEQWTRKEADLNARYSEMERKFNALAGVTPPPDPQVQNVRQQFSSLYPGLSKIEERANDILGVIERANDLESQNQHYWQSYGRQTMDRLFSTAEASIGGPLTDDGKRQLHSSFVGFIQSDPTLAERYANDPTIVEDFWKQFTSSFIDPVRRAATAGMVGRAPQNLPQDAPSGAPRTAGAPPAMTGMDERTAMAWNQYNLTKKT